MAAGFKGLLDFAGYPIGRPFSIQISGINLFISGPISNSQDISLFISGLDTKVRDISLYIPGKDNKNQELDLFVSGISEQTIFNLIDLIIIGNEVKSQDINLFISGKNNQNNNCNLYISGKDTENENLDLFIFGFDINSQNINLFIQGNEQILKTIDLFLSGKEFIEDVVDLFIKGFNTNSSNIDLFINAFNFIDGDLELFITGPIFVDGNIDLFLKVLEAKSLDLFIEGRIQPPVISCPILDPSTSVQIEDSLIKIYQSRIDALINQLGKNILLEFDPIIEPCPNCFSDIMEHRSNGIYKTGGPIPFSRGEKCPYCKGHGFLERSVNRCIKSLVQWNNRDNEFYKISVQHGGGIVRLKSYLKDYPYLTKAKTVITNHDTSNILKLRVRKIKGPVVLGLREDKFVVTYWKLI